MKLIQYYVNEVGRHLPEKMREDIQKEIHSMIEDTLEDESKAQGKPVDEEMVVAVLKRLGPPDKMASSYLPPRYLIGPELYPAFIQTVKIVLSIILVLGVVGAGLAVGLSDQLPADVSRVSGLLVQQLFDSIFSVVGIVVLIFTILQWANPKIRKSVDQNWDPRKLKADPDPETVKPAGLIVGVVFSMLFLVILNAFPQWIGFAANVEGEWRFIPVLTQAFTQYLPWISLMISLQATLNVIVAARGRWEPGTRWATIGLSLLGLNVGYAMLTGPTLVAIDPQVAAKISWFVSNPELVGNFNYALNYSMRIILGIFLATQVIEIGRTLYKLYIKRRIPHVVGA